MSRNPVAYLALAASIGLASVLPGEDLVAPPFYGDPPNETHPWGIHDRNRPQPKVVSPGGKVGEAPSDAVILFDGSQESFEKNWTLDNEKAKAAGKNWKIEDGNMVSVKGAGYIKTSSEWGDCQLHVEWAAPDEVTGASQGRGNSGVFLMGRTEVQVLDNYDNPSYPDGMAGSIYGIAPPLVNPLRKPGEFQSYDIIFRRPIYKDGKEVAPGYMTVFINGVLVQDHTILEGPGGHKGRSKPSDLGEKGPLKLQDHGNPVRFRNIWYRPLPPRSAEGGTVGLLSKEATSTQRAETATKIREHAATLADEANPMPQIIRTLESLVYADDADAKKSADAMAAKYLEGIAGLDRAKADAKKGEFMQLKGAFDYLERFGYITGDHPSKAKMQEIIKKNEWNKKK